LMKIRKNLKMMMMIEIKEDMKMIIRKKSSKTDDANDERDKKRNSKNEEDKKRIKPREEDSSSSAEKKKSKENIFEDDKKHKREKERDTEHEENGYKNGKRDHSQDKEDKIKVPKKEAGGTINKAKKEGSKEELKVKAKKHSSTPTNANACYYCKHSISSKGIMALGKKKWHADCFVCSDCEAPLGTTFCNYNDLPFCEQCYSKSFLQKCVNCYNAFGPGEVFVKALGGMWHRSCFNCNKCGRGFPDGLFSEKNGKPYCGKCSS